MDPYALGTLCVEKGLLTEAQVEELLERQRNGREWRHFGQILLEAGVLTATTMASLLSIQKQRRASNLQAAAEEAAVPESALAWLLEEAENAGAETLVISPGHAPAFRDGSGTRFVDGPPLGPAQMQKILGEALTQEHLFQVERDGAVHVTVDLEGRKGVRILLYRCQRGVAAALQLSRGDLEPRDLELPAEVLALTRQRAGLVLVAGAPGRGRDAVLETLLATVHHARACHALLLQRGHGLRPGSGRGRVTLREVGPDTDTFATGLRAAPAMDADVVCAAELEGPEDIAAALDAAHTDRLVLAGMRTRGATATVECVLDAFAGRRVPFAREALATCLRGVVAAQILPARGGAPPAVAVEFLPNTAAVAALIRDGRCGHLAHLLKQEPADGIVSMEHSLAAHYGSGRIRAADAMQLAYDREVLRRLLEKTAEGVRAGH